MHVRVKLNTFHVYSFFLKFFLSCREYIVLQNAVTDFQNIADKKGSKKANFRVIFNLLRLYIIFF